MYNTSRLKPLTESMYIALNKDKIKMKKVHLLITTFTNFYSGN